jgi:hypothetical protein
MSMRAKLQVKPVVKPVITLTKARQTLACWVMVPEYAADIWSRGADLILDLCMVDPRRCKDGQWYGVQLLAGYASHPPTPPSSPPRLASSSPPTALTTLILLA